VRKVICKLEDLMLKINASNEQVTKCAGSYYKGNIASETVGILGEKASFDMEREMNGKILLVGHVDRLTEMMKSMEKYLGYREEQSPETR